VTEYPPPIDNASSNKSLSLHDSQKLATDLGERQTTIKEKEVIQQNH
jgi:hypothetical protein